MTLGKVLTYVNRRVVSSMFLLAGVLVSGCTKPDSAAESPTGKIKEYISRSFSISAAGDRKKLEELLTKDAKKRLSSWSDEQFLKAFVDTKRKFFKLSFKEVRQPNPDEAQVTYELIFGQNQKGGQETRITQKKVAQMVREGGQWFIQDVKSVKELIEYENEMSLP